MQRIRMALAGILAAAVLSLPVLATELGDAAPPLKVAEWVKGQPVDLKAGEGKNVFVVEFWATWCGPCIRSMPHMTAMQKKFKDKGVVFISVTKKDPRNDLDKVKAFVKDNDANMGYTVAFDKDTETYDAYMKAFKKNGIPQSFVIDKKGKIVWEGHPMFGLEQVIEAVVSGNSDSKALMEISKKAEEDFEKANKERMELFQGYMENITASKDGKGAAELGDKLFKLIETDAMMLNQLAWTILTEEKVLHRDIPFALKVAKAAVDASKGEDAAILDTYARAQFDSGKVADALETQRKAVKLCKDEAMKKDLEEALEKYEKAAKEKK